MANTTKKCTLRFAVPVFGEEECAAAPAGQVSAVDGSPQELRSLPAGQAVPTAPPTI